MNKSVLLHKIDTYHKMLPSVADLLQDWKMPHDGDGIQQRCHISFYYPRFFVGSSLTEEPGLCWGVWHFSYPRGKFLTPTNRNHKITESDSIDFRCDRIEGIIC